VTATEVEAWLGEVVDQGLLQQPSSVATLDNGHIAVTSAAFVGGQLMEIVVEIPSGFPRGLPLVYLKNADGLGYLPHVFSRGEVCLIDKEGLLLDRQHPDRVLTWAVERAVKVLTDAVLGNKEAEFIRELEVYWDRLNGEDVFNCCQPTGEAGLLTSYRNGEAHWIARHADELPRALRLQTNSSVSADLTTYLPLLPGTAFVPPRPSEPFWAIEQLLEVAGPTLAVLSHKRRRQLFKRKGCWKGLLVLAVPLTESRYTLIGIAFESPRGVHPFDERAVNADFILRPVTIHRWERSYLVPRGGGKAELAAKRVLLVGCGAIGGFLAFELIRAGVQWMTLVDGDILSPVNMHRHVLGWSSMHKPKTRALRDELHRQFLYAEVTAVPKTIEQAMADGEVQFDTYDLVLAATGDATIELYLNEELRRSPKAPPAMFTWLEPYGLGGHTLLTQPFQPGCLQCLYARANPAAPLANRALFAAPDQHFSLALSGCASLHTPYGAQDAAQTATLAARLAIDALTGREQGSPLWSWKGDKRAFEAAGFDLAPRYSLSDEVLRKEAQLYINPGCHVCGARLT
jgi:molybdopterin-synthase adenylyltransferase